MVDALPVLSFVPAHGMIVSPVVSPLRGIHPVGSYPLPSMELVDGDDDSSGGDFLTLSMPTESSVGDTWTWGPSVPGTGRELVSAGLLTDVGMTQSVAGIVFACVPRCALPRIGGVSLARMGRARHATRL